VRATTTHPQRRDGFTIVECLIAIVLLGGVIAGTLAALRASTVGGSIQRDHARAHAWLQSASDILYAADKVNCNTADADAGEAKVRAAYDVIIRSVPNPPEWAEWQLRFVRGVQFWNSANTDADPDIEFFFGANCDPSLGLQLIELEVRSPNGNIIETVELVK
jgi:prepilin-type N-terminal cleavage/methylation domain-containing protein